MLFKKQNLLIKAILIQNEPIKKFIGTMYVQD